MTMLDFSKSVRVTEWKAGQWVGSFPAENGFAMMARSTCFDNEHATENVRRLHPLDAHHLGLEENTPVVFGQS